MELLVKLCFGNHGEERRFWPPVIADGRQSAPIVSLMNSDRIIVQYRPQRPCVYSLRCADGDLLIHVLSWQACCKVIQQHPVEAAMSPASIIDLMLDTL